MNIKIPLHDNVLLTPPVRELLEELGVSSHGGFSVVGQILSRTTVVTHSVIRFRVRYVFQDSSPILFMDDIVTLTLSQDVDLCVVPESSGMQTLRILYPTEIEGVCFQKDEELSVHIDGDSLHLEGNGISMSVRKAFMQRLHLISREKVLYRAISRIGDNWSVIGAYAYVKDDVYKSIPNVVEVTTEPLRVGIYTDSELRLALGEYKHQILIG